MVGGWGGVCMSADEFDFLNGVYTNKKHVWSPMFTSVQAWIHMRASPKAA